MPTTATNLLTAPTTLPLIAPSILSADFAHLADDCAHALNDAGAHLLHIDVMDGHFVPNLTMGPAIVASLRKALPDAFLDVHVMVTDPGQYLAPFAKAGADHITYHLEPVLDPTAGAGASPLSQGYDPIALAQQCHDLGMTAGIALNPPTPASALLDRPDLLEALDLILIMSVNPGFSGQAFIESALDKAAQIAPHLRPSQRLQMDGGVSPANATRVRNAGVDVLVAASAIFGLPPQDRKNAVQALKTQ